MSKKRAKRTDYGAFGLDRTKRSKDPPKTDRLFWCPFTDRYFTRGYSMCWANWIISLEAVKILINSPPMANPENESCWGCGTKTEPMYWPIMADERKGWMGYCRACIESAERHLEREKIYPPGTQFTLF